jgi:HK97 family phage major capsid protein
MSDIISKGTMLPESVVGTLINTVKGKSSLAELCAAEPVAFNGQKEFTFAFDREVDVVAENGAKSKGGVTINPVTIIPVKVEYGTRISDEFLFATEEYQIDVLDAFAQGFAAKVARGIDIMAFHGFNPRTGAASAVIGNNHFDNKVTQVVTATANPDNDMESAVTLIEGNDCAVTGAAISPAFRSALAQLVDGNGRKIYPELSWGQAIGAINGLPVSANGTVSFGGSTDKAIVGDFAGSFKWGYAKEIPLEIIPYGNPDNDGTLGDLKGHNQIYLRSEVYVGWGILVPNAFAIIRP